MTIVMIMEKTLLDNEGKPEKAKVKTPGVKAMKIPLVRFSFPPPSSSPDLDKDKVNWNYN